MSATRACVIRFSQLNSSCRPAREMASTPNRFRMMMRMYTWRGSVRELAIEEVMFEQLLTHESYTCLRGPELAVS